MPPTTNPPLDIPPPSPAPRLGFLSRVLTGLLVGHARQLQAIVDRTGASFSVQCHPNEEARIVFRAGQPSIDAPALPGSDHRHARFDTALLMWRQP